MQCSAALRFRSALGSQRADLEDIRAEVLENKERLEAAVATAIKAVASLQADKDALVRKGELLRESLGDRQRVEDELRASAESKDSQLARLQAEVQRLGREAAEQQAQAEASRGDAEALQAALDRAEMQASRQAIRGGGGADGREEVAELRVALEARVAEVARLQEEMEVQGRAHQLRTSEMQDACQAKIRELRRGHEQQLTAAAKWQLSSSAAEQQAEQAAAALGALETKHAQREEQLRADHGREADALRSKVEELRAALHSAQEGRGNGDGEQQAQSVLNEAVEAARQHKRVAEALQATNERLQREKQQAAAESAGLLQQRNALAAEVERLRAGSGGGGGAGGGGGGEVDMELLDMMEQKLVNLSGIIRAKEEECAAMRHTIQTQIQERAATQRELAAAKKAVEAAPVAAAVRSASRATTQGRPVGYARKGR